MKGEKKEDNKLLKYSIEEKKIEYSQSKLILNTLNLLWFYLFLNIWKV